MLKHKVCTCNLVIRILYSCCPLVRFNSAERLHGLIEYYTLFLQIAKYNVGPSHYCNILLFIRSTQIWFQICILKYIVMMIRQIARDTHLVWWIWESLQQQWKQLINMSESLQTCICHDNDGCVWLIHWLIDYNGCILIEVDEEQTQGEADNPLIITPLFHTICMHQTNTRDIFTM